MSTHRNICVHTLTEHERATPMATAARATALLLTLLSIAATCAYAVDSPPPPPPDCSPPNSNPKLSDAAAIESVAAMECAARWHGWCAGRVEAFNSRVRREVTATHVGIYRGKSWGAAVRKMRDAGCSAHVEWMVPHHPDNWHGLGTAAGYGEWGAYWRRGSPNNNDGDSTHDAFAPVTVELTVPANDAKAVMPQVEKADFRWMCGKA